MKNNKIQKKKATKKRGGLFAFLFAIVDAIAKFLKRGPIGFFFADLYTRCNKQWKRGWLYNILRRRKQKFRERATFAQIYEKSIFSRRMSGLSNSIIHSHLRIWGMGLLFFAFSILAVTFVKYKYFGVDIMENSIISGVMVFIAFILIISRKEVGEALLAKRLTRFVITDVLNLNPSRFEKSDTPFEGSYFVAILFSMALGSLTYFVHPLFIVACAGLLALFALLMSYPELGLVFLMILFPFASIFFKNPSIAILVLVGFTTCGFIVKLLRGKRVIRFELIDIFTLAFGGLILFGGIFTYGGADSLNSAGVYFAFLFVYFLIVNMYIGKSAIYRAFKILVVCATLVSIVGVLNKGVISSGYVDMSMFADMPGRVSVFLDNPNMLGAYLVLAFPLTLGEMVVCRKKMGKVMYFISAILIIACTILTGSRGAWLGMLVSLVAFLLIYNIRNIWLVGAVAATVPFWHYFVPQFIINRFTSIFTLADTSSQMHLNIWGGAWSMAKDNFFTGIGVGERAFEVVYSNYAIKGAESAVHAHSLPLQILVELGIVGLVVFFLVMFMYSQKCFVEIKQGERKSKSRTMIIAGLSSIIGILVMGLTDNVWYNYRVFIAFWIVLGLVSALTRINVRQREVSKTVANMTSAELDINI